MTPLHPRFGVEIDGIDLRTVTAESGYPEIREAFEAHSLLLFRGQRLDDDSHQALGSLFGPIEDRTMGKSGPKPPMDEMTNRLADGTICGERDSQTLDLIANQLWHTDSTFLPVPALANILTARVLTSSGGETEFVSTRAAWRELPDHVRVKVRHAVLRHGLMHSRKKISAELAKEERFVKWGERSWKAVWHNP